jgi:hypothetical protein
MASKDEVAKVEIPDWLKGQQVPTGDTEALAGLSTKIPRISLKGRKFRLIVDGEEIIKPADALDAVILAVEPEKGRMAKTFYAKGYSSGDTEPPTCSSQDGIRPDAWINDPIAPMCSTCENNRFGSATSMKGKPSKACRDSKRLWMGIPENDKNGELGLGMGGTIFGLGVPVTSLGSLAELGKQVAKNGYPLAACIVRMEMVDAEYPQIDFQFSGFLGEKEGKVAIERNVSRDWLSVVPAGPALENSSKPPPNLIDEVNKVVKQTVESNKANSSVDSVIGDWGTN